MNQSRIVCAGFARYSGWHSAFVPDASEAVSRKGAAKQGGTTELNPPSLALYAQGGGFLVCRRKSGFVIRTLSETGSIHD